MQASTTTDQTDITDIVWSFVIGNSSFRNIDAGVSGRARSPPARRFRARERLARECEPYQTATADAGGWLFEPSEILFALSPIPRFRDSTV